MSENKHTPEPWYVVDKPWGDGTWINSGSPDPHHEGFVADCEDMNGDVDKDTARINARRIVAAVNACAGISQQYLEELNGETLADKQMVLITQRDEYSLLAYRRQNILDEVIKQRDELLKALENTHNALKHFWPEGHADAIAAIASVSLEDLK